MNNINRRLRRNTISSLFLQMTTIVCGFILPRLILDRFGSEVNGLVNSITQFLSMIAFLDLGVGAVFQASLYKPLAEGDNCSLSKIFSSGQKFFARLAEILLGYVILLVFIYPSISNQNFGFLYTSSLIVAMSVSSFAQYYFGMANGLLLNADQRGYVSYNIQIITLVLNTLACYSLICLGATIHTVKLTTSFIYLVRPIILKLYVDKNYQIDHNIEYIEEPIKQKWNGLAQHITAVVLESTGIIVLTVFSSLSAVSIYSVYYLVISGIKQLFTAATNGVQALIGDLYAKNNFLELQKVFRWTEWVLHTSVTFVFGCTLVLIVPFVLVYTRGITDADYNQQLFAAFIVLSYALYCYRLPYHIVIKAIGHFQQTQKCYYIATALNVFISIVAVSWFSLTGVAIGTLIAMAYQTTWMAYYDSKNVLNYNVKIFFKQIIVDLLTLVLGFVISSIIVIDDNSYFSWIFMAIKVSLVWLLIIAVINFIFYKSMMATLFNRIVIKISK